MRLTILSDYGASEKLVSEEATAEIVEAAIRSLDWSGFHQVVLQQANGDWFEVGGSLGEDGLSAVYEQAGEQYVVAVPPASIDELVELHLLYLAGSPRWRRDWRWE